MISGQPRHEQLARAALLTLIVLSVAATGSATADRLDGKLEAAIHLKVLDYDRTLKKRAGGSLVIAIVTIPGHHASETTGKIMDSSFREVGRGLKVRGMSVTVVSLAYQADTLAQDLAASNAAIVYVTPGLDRELAKIHAAAQQRHAATLCGDRAQVRNGVAIGVYLRGRSAAITINLRTARSLGMDLDSAVFAVAEVIK